MLIGPINVSQVKKGILLFIVKGHKKVAYNEFSIEHKGQSMTRLLIERELR